MRKGHEFACPTHGIRVAQGTTCSRCKNEADLAEKAAKAEKLKEEQERKKAIEKENDFFSRTGKDRKPRASKSDESSSSMAT